MEEEKVEVLPVSQMQKALRLKGKFGQWVARRVMKLLDIDKVNELQSRYPDLKGPEFSEKILEEVGVKYDIPAEDLKNERDFRPKAASLLSPITISAASTASS